ncbi:hypothetical protein OSTOST_11299 [Ostertagia ostertagi]
MFRLPHHTNEIRLVAVHRPQGNDFSNASTALTPRRVRGTMIRQDGPRAGDFFVDEYKMPPNGSVDFESMRHVSAPYRLSRPVLFCLLS